MSQSEHKSVSIIGGSARVSCALGALLILGLLFAAPALATFEQVETFADNPGNFQLENTTGLAVNITGAGGVPAGTFYAVSLTDARIVRYAPDGEYRASWGYNVAEYDNSAPGAPESFQRCGPDGEAVHPVCPGENNKAYTPEGNKYSGGVPGDGVGQLQVPQGIAVDQTTGDVYVLNTRENNGQAVVQVFSADGSELVTSFGEQAFLGFPSNNTFSESIAETPEKFHRSFGIAVDASGNVYVSDNDDINIRTTPEQSRVMLFKPQSPGDYEHYVYSGRANDIAASNGQVSFNPRYVAIDNADDLYVANDERIYEFAAGEPDAPLCEYAVPSGLIEAFAVNPVSGEVFYGNYKTRKVFQLSACDGEGHFTQTAAFERSVSGPVNALALNPNQAFEASRPVGILYGAGSSIGFIFAQAEVRSPSVKSEEVSSVTASTAVLSAQINPNGSPTRYNFQYITEAAYQANEPGDRFAGAVEAPLGSAALGSGQGTLNAATALAGLAPDSVYHYRAVATSRCEPENEAAPCEAFGADQSFRTFPAEAPILPDGRAYELVSPANKNGGEVFPSEPEAASCGSECKPTPLSESYPIQSSPDGEAVVYQGSAFSFTEGAAILNEYISKRTPEGWQTTSLAPSLLTKSSGGAGYRAFDANLTGAVILQGGSVALSPDAPAGIENLYTQPTANPLALTPLLTTAPPNRAPRLTYAGASADLSRIFFEANDALTGETPFAPEAVDGGANKDNLYESSGGQLRLVNVAPENRETTPGAAIGSLTGESGGGQFDRSHAISSDGSRVFWSSESGQVYVRENGETSVKVPGTAKFLTASADGSKLLLADGALYNVNDLSEAPVDLTEGQGGFQGIVGQSEDLRSIYFVDTAVLDETENEFGAKAQSGKDNLYSWDGTSTFVATLAAGDNRGLPGSAGGGGDWFPAPSRRTAEASPDGQWAAFVSTASLTGYDNVGPCGFDVDTNEVTEAPCAEDFLYDSATGKLRCASCNPSGARPLGRALLTVIGSAADSLPQPRYLTDSGRLYFDTRDSISPFDTNGGVEDVYQWEPGGIGSCTRAEGCVQLVSSGHGDADSDFLTMDPTGKNVFFTTRDTLVPRDRDDLIDVYDAREGGGIAAETESGSNECQGEACQPIVSAPNDPTPSSSTFNGAGNLREKPVTKKHKKHSKHHRSKKPHQRSHGRSVNRNRRGAK